MRRREFRFVPLFGVLFIVVVGVGLVMSGDTPSHHALGAEIRDAYDNETQHQIAAFLIALAAIPLLVFAGHFRAVLKPLDRSGQLAANLELVGAVVAATGLCVQALIHAALAEAAQTPELSDEALQSLNALDGWSFYPFSIGFSTMLLASGAALTRRRDLFAPMLAWAAVALGLLVLVPIVGFFAAILAGIWVITISLTLFARADAVERMWDETTRAQPTPTLT